MNLLIVCSRFKDLSFIDKIDLSKYSKVILASDDLRIHKNFHQLKMIKEITFLSKPIPYTVVSNEVIKIIDKVNNYLGQLGNLNIFNKQDLFWTYHVEGGGYTTQKIQDILLAIESAHNILNEYSINELFVIGSKNDLSIKTLLTVSQKRQYKINNFNSYGYQFNKAYVKLLIRPFYLLLRSIYCKITSKKIDYPKNCKLMIFQICGSSYKHIQNAIFPQNNLKLANFLPLNIIWGNTKEVKKLNLKGHKALALEYYIKFYELFLSFIKIFYLLCKYKKLKELFYKDKKYSYKDNDIRDYIFKSIFLYLLNEGAENYRYRVAAQRFKSHNSKNIIAIKYCAVKSLTQGTILSEILEDKYLKIDYDVGLRMRDYYDENNSKKNFKFLSNNFLRFTRNEIERNNLIEDMKVSKKSVKIFGNGRAISHFKNRELLSKSESIKKLKIKKVYEIHALLDLQAPVSGFISLEEVMFLSNTLIEFVKTQKNIALIIKPYHSVDNSLIDTMLENKTDNIFLVDKYSKPDHALNISDIVFSKFSTLGVEGMIYDAQVVSIILDNEKLFKVYGKSAVYISKKEDLKIFLNSTLNSKKSFDLWKESFKKNREKFLNEYYPKLEKTSEEIIVDEICKIL